MRSAQLDLALGLVELLAAQELARALQMLGQPALVPDGLRHQVAHAGAQLRRYTNSVPRSAAWPL